MVERRAREGEYGFDNAWTQARARLTELENWLDPATERALTGRVAPGASCLEIGAGGGSVARLLAERVGSGGRVLATDLDPRFLTARPPVEVARHDVGRDPLPADTFDLAHTRLVLAHVPDRDAALARIVASLRPGGWVVCEEMDFVSVVADPTHRHAVAFGRAMDAHLDVLRRHNFDPEYGRRLVPAMSALGLRDVGAEGHVQVCVGGTPAAGAWRLTFEQLGPEMVETGTDQADVDLAVALCDDPGFTFVSQIIMAAWGRRA